MAKPKNCISVSEAKDLHSNWTNTRAIEVNRLVNEEVDTRDFTFSVEDLQEYLDYIREESSKQRISNPGIRIYFAAYNETDNYKATVFLAPTTGVEKDSDNNYEIDPFNKGISGWPPNNY